MDYIGNHNRIVSSRDDKNGDFRIRVDYLADRDVLNFYVEGDKTFTVTKQILHQSNNGVAYTIVVENVGGVVIDTPIVLYSDNDGVFTTQKIFKRDIVGRELTIKSMRPGQKVRAMLLVKKISDKGEAERLIRELTEDTIYGKKILSVFERFSEELRNDKELFIEGLQHNPHVMEFASEELHKDLELQTIYTNEIVKMKK